MTGATTTNSSPQPVLTGSLLGRAVRQQQGAGAGLAGAPLHSSALLMGGAQGGPGPGGAPSQPLSALHSSPHQRIGEQTTHGHNSNNNRELSMQGQGPGRGMGGVGRDSSHSLHGDLTIAEAFDESSWDEEDDE